MNPTATSDELATILRDQLHIDVSTFTADSHLVDEVGLDSVGFAVVMAAVEDKFGVELSEEELLSCHTLGDLDAAIRTR